MGEMHDQPDAQLLRAYAERGAEATFAEIVARHTDLVYSAALRQVYSPDLARDVTQSVFTDLARKARTVCANLSPEASLVGWLYRGTRFAARDLYRNETRRTQRERQAMEQLLSAPENVPDWEQLRPVLDDAMSELDDTDRDAVLLRYFKNHDLRTVGATLGISDDAAQKRVSRAVERLREFFAKRGVTVGASGLAVVISANAVQAAPVGLALTISTAALTSAVVSAVTTKTTIVAATKTIAMTTLQKIAIAAVITAGISIPLVVRHQSQAKLDAANKAAQEQTAQTDPQPKENATQSSDPATNSNKPSREELRRRGEVGRLLREQAEARAKSTQKATPAPNTPVEHDGVQSRYQNAQQLARNGDPAGALKEYLWCFDEGMVKVESFKGVRTSFLLSSIAELGKDYPEALTALRERRDSVSQRFLSGDSDHNTAYDLASLNRALKDDQHTLSLLDQLPAGDSRRKPLAAGAYDQLVEAQRYG
ncbi:MAG: sigma-70 family RNA polymerase sigma factor, partial [Verrucomicrobia bacterium]